ncbi:glycosyltransferase family 39 protein [uncultured Sphingomonas sp.]|uniref:glycosyltransferase family 39 protein n=1 Tax=uncultured Sphingomonas sp. TaxID=158754 RepID=UPI0025D45F43|nr:glycosyltransferase family 39 protein [uncultured Sphingomonas sp.]
MRARLILPLLLVAFLALAMTRPVDHDESQYVAAAVLSAKGLLPYRDYAYLQTPLQPLLIAPVAAIAGAWTWPALRLVNALLGWLTVVGIYVTARRSGAGERAGLIAALGLAACDILLFSAAMARNDALPAAMLAGAMIAMAGRPTRANGVLAGLLLAGAAAAKISYSLPAAAVGLWMLWRRERMGWLVVGAALPVGLVAWLWWLAPADALFGVLTFPAKAPAEFYADRPWKLSLAAKAVDTLKFLALGPALLAAVAVGRGRALQGPWLWLALAGLIAALLPEPTWRQYWLPALPPLFVMAALGIDRCPPTRAMRLAAIPFVVAGLAPSLVALATGSGMIAAMRERAVIGEALGARSPVATLSPQFVTDPDPRFAAGPFAFRIRRFLSPDDEVARGIVTPRTLTAQFAAHPPGAILIGGEGKWTSGTDGAEAPLEAWARANSWRQVPLASRRFRVWVP